MNELPNLIIEITTKELSIDWTNNGIAIRMNGWMNEWIKEWVNKEMSEWMNQWTNESEDYADGPGLFFGGRSGMKA